LLNDFCKGILAELTGYVWSTQGLCGSVSGMTVHQHPGDGNIPDKNILSDAGKELDRGGYTQAGRSYHKHASRDPGKWGSPRGNAGAINQKGQLQLDEIISSPNTSWETRHHAKFGDIIEGKLPDGRAARWSTNGNFIGFIEV
jgi:hypothetical protein